MDGHVDELVELVRTLVSFDTTSVDLSPDSEHTENDEAALQAYVGEGARGDRRRGRPVGAGPGRVSRSPDDAALASLAEPPPHGRHARGVGRRPLARGERPHRRRQPRRRVELGVAALRGRGSRRPHLRARGVRHEGRRRCRPLRVEGACTRAGSVSPETSSSKPFLTRRPARWGRTRRSPGATAPTPGSCPSRRASTCGSRPAVSCTGRFRWKGARPTRR